MVPHSLGSGTAIERASFSCERMVRHESSRVDDSEWQDAPIEILAAETAPEHWPAAW
jgi:hypothetical protein